MAEEKVLKQDLFSTKIFSKETARLSKEWFREKLKTLSKKDFKETATSDLRYRGKLPLLGRMCYFAYRAKGEGTKALPYYDRAPLAIIIDETADRFLSLNLHYLPPALRATLLTRLLDVINNERFDKTTKLKISYALLKGVSKYRYFKPCLKQHLKSHIKSNIMIIRPSQWHLAIMLPSQKFYGASTTEVWNDSKSIYSGRK